MYSFFSGSKLLDVILFTWKLKELYVTCRHTWFIFVVMKAMNLFMSYSWQTLSGPTVVPDSSNTKTVSNGSACGHCKKSELQGINS